MMLRPLLAACCLLLPSLAHALNLGAIRPDEVAIWMAPQDGGPAIVQHRADAPMNPASTMKLLTTLSALELLAPDYRWRTELLADARPRGDTLEGPLYWKGGGDPHFDRNDLAALARDLRGRGIRHLAGDVVLDKQRFARTGSADDFASDSDKAFAVPPDALLAHLKVVWTTLFVQPDGVRVALDPPLDGLKVDNRLTVSQQANCEGGVKRYASLSAQGDTLRLEGALPVGCDGGKLFAPVWEHDAYQAAMFAALWREAGGSLAGQVRRGLTPANAVTLASVSSPTLAEVVRDINKYSNNTMARQLFLTLGAEFAQEGDVLRDGEAAVRRWATQRKLALPGLQLENGSGLSRRERISAAGLGALLQAGANSPYAPEFMASLPIAARDGTLRRRFVGQPVEARLKTGSLNDVRALAGYVKAVDGRRYALVVLINSPRASELTPAMDALVAGLIRHPGRLEAEP